MYLSHLRAPGSLFRAYNRSELMHSLYKLDFLVFQPVVDKQLTRRALKDCQREVHMSSKKLTSDRVEDVKVTQELTECGSWGHFIEEYIPTCLSSPYVIIDPTTNVPSDGCELIRKDQVMLTVFPLIFPF